MAKHTLQERMYYTADRARLVPEGDPEAAYLYGIAGAEVDADEAARLGLTGKRPPAPAPVVVPSTAADPAEPTVEFEAAPELEARVAEGKAVREAAVEDKAVEGPKAAGKGR